MLPIGLLNLNKPSGMTSRRAVDVVQRLARPAKAGHAGTLDPLASGVLVVCVGAATRLIEYVQRMPKRYRGTFLLGRSSTTEDIEGDVVELASPPIPTQDQICEAARQFVGRILQRPPAFSALKVGGRRAYDLARAGRAPELAPRPIDVFSIEVITYDYPELILDVACGSGTYIRSLGRDLGESLGTAAVMSALVRTAIGGFHIEEAVEPGQLDAAHWLERLESPLRAVEQLPRVQLSADEAKRIRNGQAIDAERIGDLVDFVRQVENRSCVEMAAVDPDGQLAAILTRLDSGQWRAARNF
ncbi:MAG: tRNA pseudouridine(55) synthase TruB [Thermoguttaceae bacterium]